MPQQITTAVENNFTKGLITEATALNFPENAATDTDNCIYTLLGDVTRRLGIDYEDNFQTAVQDRSNRAVNTFKWNNAGGDGLTQLVVAQVGMTLLFYQSSASTSAAPVSTQKLFSTVDMTVYQTGVSPNPAFEECQFASGNGYLFVYHPRCQPFFCNFASGVVTSSIITVNIRDFTGVLESGGSPVTDRPTSLTNEHLYNLINQGWTQGNPWQAISGGAGPASAGSGILGFQVSPGITGTNIGDQVYVVTTQDFWTGSGFIAAGTGVMAGVLSSYVGTTMNINITGDLLMARGSQLGPYKILPYNKGYINTWNGGLGNFPSNSDVWWYFKNATNSFDPVATINQVTINTGNAPRGHFIIDAFNQNKSVISSVSSITTVSTSLRPRTGTWFQGRVWYTGVDAAQAKTGNANFYTWSSNIYFSQVVIGPEQFGMCHQLNDPTSETLFDLLPTDGGVITIQEAGAIYKLFPIQNGLLVFASNGIWFITGSQGIGFAANDYTVTKISSIPSISGTSFVDVNGLPYFWNEEGIYTVQPAKGGGLEVDPITVLTIDSYYDEIPVESKRYARGAFDPVNYNIQWLFRSVTDSDNITSRYEFDKILTYNTYNKCFYPYSLGGALNSAHPQMNGILYLTYPGSQNSPPPSFKYFCSEINTVTFADEHDTDYVDWASSINGAVNFDSFFITGYKIRGQGIRKFQPQYIQIYSRTNGEASAYKLQGIWDYANSQNSGRWSALQLVTNGLTRQDTMVRRHKIRGHGYALQFKVSSADGMPFDIQGWIAVDTVNQGT